MAMAQYLMACYYGDQGFSQEEFAELCVDVPAFTEKVREAGAFVFQGGLVSPTTTATVVRKSGDDFLITDGPFAETKEHLGGFWIIDVADLDAALGWAKQATAAARVPVEVTPFEMRTIDELLAASAAGEL
jgi:hypothetical protein